MLILALLVTTAAPADGKTMASDDWHSVSIYGVAAEGNGSLFLQVHAGDLDGDGLPDDAVLKLACAGDQLMNVHYNVISPRDAASGQASGKRMHKPVTFVKEWGAATPQLAAMKPSYDVKKVEGTGARMTDNGEGWTQMSLNNAEGLCPAAARATKTRSNIQNN